MPLNMLWGAVAALAVVHIAALLLASRRSSSPWVAIATHILVGYIEAPALLFLVRRGVLNLPDAATLPLLLFGLLFSTTLFWWMFFAIAKRWSYRAAFIVYTVERAVTVGASALWILVQQPTQLVYVLLVQSGAILAILCISWILWAIARKWGTTAAIATVTFVGSAVSASLIWKLRTLPETPAGVFVLQDQAYKVGVVLSVTVVVFSLLLLALPKILDVFERGDFISFVAARHVRSKKSGFLTIISLLSILGVALSSMALCWVISIMGGFGADLKTKILDNNANIRIESPDAGGFEYWREIVEETMKLDGVAAATPVAGGEVMASSSTTTAGVQLRGIETQSFRKVVDVPERMEVGSFDYLDAPLKLATLPPDTPIHVTPKGEVFFKPADPEYEELKDTDEEPEDVYPGVVLGRELARSLHAYVGDELTLVSPMGDLGPMGLMPRSRKFRVAGVFYTGMYEYDASHAYVEIEAGQELLDLKHFVTAVDIRVDNFEAAEVVTPRLEAAINRPDLKIRDWKEMNRNLFSALQLEKLATFVILSIAITVASFCIICTLLLMVTEKSKEIAIMKALGASDQAIRWLFLFEGMLIGGVGTLFGVVLGYTTMAGLKKAEIRLDPEVYYIERLPVTVEPVDYFWIAVCAFVITTIATLYPARAASRLSPVDGIRYE